MSALIKNSKHATFPPSSTNSIYLASPPIHLSRICHFSTLWICTHEQEALFLLYKYFLHPLYLSLYIVESLVQDKTTASVSVQYPRMLANTLREQTKSCQTSRKQAPSAIVKGVATQHRWQRTNQLFWLSQSADQLHREIHLHRRLVLGILRKANYCLQGKGAQKFQGHQWK